MAYTVEDLYLVARHDYLETLTSDLIDPVKGVFQKTRDAWNHSRDCLPESGSVPPSDFRRNLRKS